MDDFPIAITDAHKQMATQVLSEDKVRDGFARLLLDMIYRDMGLSA